MVPFERALVSFYRPSIEWTAYSFLYLYAFQSYCRFCSPACHFFPTPLLFGLKFRGVPFGVDPWCWGAQRSGSLTNHPWYYFYRIMPEFQRVWSQSTNVTDVRRTDRQTDRQLIMAIPRYATLRAVKTRRIRHFPGGVWWWVRSRLTVGNWLDP